VVVSRRHSGDCEKDRREHVGGGRPVPNAVQLRDHKAQLHAVVFELLDSSPGVKP
jgi:hypothetical protein